MSGAWDGPADRDAIALRRAGAADAAAVAEVFLASFQATYEQNGFVAAWLGDGSANDEGQPDVRYAWRP